MKLKDYMLIILIVVVTCFVFRACTTKDSSLELFKEILKREDLFRDSIHSQELKIANLRSSTETQEYNFNYQNKRVTRQLEKPIIVSKKDSTNCLPFITSLFNCNSLLFDYQKSSLSLNRVKDSLIFALDENSILKDEFLKLKDDKFKAKPNKGRFYFTASGSVNPLGFDDIKLGGLLTTKKRLAFGYQYGVINKSHELKIGFNPFKN